MDTYEEALTIAREVGDTYGETMMLVNVGARLISLGAAEDGATILEHAIRLSEELGPMGMKLRQRAEGLLVPGAHQARSQGGSRQRERTSPAQPAWVRGGIPISRGPVGGGHHGAAPGAAGFAHGHDNQAETQPRW